MSEVTALLADGASLLCIWTWWIRKMAIGKLVTVPLGLKIRSPVPFLDLNNWVSERRPISGLSKTSRWRAEFLQLEPIFVISP